MTNSKLKGNLFERKMANHLSERFADHLGVEKGFRRDISSGSFFGATNQKRLETHLTENATFGDIMAPSSFRFSIECKHYKTAPSFASMVKQQYGQFGIWITQARQDAVNAELQMLVIIKFNSVPEFVIIEGDDPDAFGHYKGTSLITLEKWLERDVSYFFTE